MKRLLPAAALAMLLAAPALGEETTTNTTAPTPAPDASGLPAGSYTLDKYHSTLIFRVSHLGYSFYTGQFKRFDAKLELDPANPAAAKLEATVDPTSLDVPPPPEGFIAELTGPNWLDAGKFPQMTFRSTAVEVTGKNTARITGDFTFHGVTKPVVLEATFNGGYAGFALDPHARIGFSAKGGLKRSEFGVANGVPAAGSNMGVSDDVQVIIETEFSGPEWKNPKPAE